MSPVVIPGEGVILPDGRFVPEAQIRALIDWVRNVRDVLAKCGVVP